MDQQNLSTASEQRLLPTSGSDSSRMPRAHVEFENTVYSNLPVLAKMFELQIDGMPVSSTTNVTPVVNPMPEVAKSENVPISEHLAALKKISQLTSQLTNQTARIQNSIDKLSQNTKPRPFEVNNIIYRDSRTDAIEISEVVSPSSSVNLLDEVIFSTANEIPIVEKVLPPAKVVISKPEMKISQPKVAETKAVEPVVETALPNKPVAMSAIAHPPQPIKAPQFAQTGFRPELVAIVRQLSKDLRLGKCRVWQFHTLPFQTTDQSIGQLWPLAHCWAEMCEETLLVIDATKQGLSMSSVMGWDEAYGLQDVVLQEKQLGSTIRETNYPRLSFLPRGITALPVAKKQNEIDEHQLRLKSLLMAVQRDYSAIWVITSGDWDQHCQSISQLVNKRELVVPLGSRSATTVWNDFSKKLLEQNVLINGWLGLGTTKAAKSFV